MGLAWSPSFLSSCPKQPPPVVPSLLLSFPLPFHLHDRCAHDQFLFRLFSPIHSRTRPSTRYTWHPVQPLPPQISSPHLQRVQGCRPPSPEAPTTSGICRAQLPSYVATPSLSSVYRSATVTGIRWASAVTIIPTPRISFFPLSIATDDPKMAECLLELFAILLNRSINLRQGTLLVIASLSSARPSDRPSPPVLTLA